MPDRPRTSELVMYMVTLSDDGLALRLERIADNVQSIPRVERNALLREAARRLRKPRPEAGRTP